MRIRSTERPPVRADIERIVREGAAADDELHFRHFLRRMQKALFLDAQNQPLPPRERLVKQYTRDGLVLFLGAGVSRDSGIPNWPELADALLLKSGVEPDDLDTVKKALPSYLTQFELAGQLLGTPRRLAEEIYQGLYEQMKCRPQLMEIPRKYEKQRGWDGWGDVLKALQANKTLRTVGDLLITDDGPKARRNPQIHAVLTFNADNLLELYCAAKTGGKHILTLVDRASVGEHPDETPVYHLHGTLDARGENLFRSVSTSASRGKLQEMSDELLPDLIFRESEYYETIANPASFVNHTPQSFLRRLNALFIGTSLDDLNMRRWLHDSFRERVLHRTKYLREFYVKEYPDAGFEAELESRRHFWVRPESERDKDKGGRPWHVPKKHVDCVMSNLGVQVIWCKDHDDMRSCVHEVQKRGCNLEFGRRVAEFPS
jgi:SIR2-like domain